MADLTFKDNYNGIWFQVYSGDFIGYINKKEKYFEPVLGLDKLSVKELEEILSEMKKL